MCDPLTIAGTLLSVGATAYGGFSQQQAQQNAAKARYRAIEESRREQRQHRLQAAEELGKGTNAVAQSNNPAAVRQAQERREAQLSEVNAAPPVQTAPIGGKGSAPKIVQTDLGNKMAAAGRRNTERTARTAAVGGYDDLGVKRAQGVVEAGRGINQIADFASGDLRLLPLKIAAAEQAALNKGATGRMIADIVGAIGSAGTAAGARGFGPSWGSLFGSSVPNSMFTEFSMYPGAK